MLPVVLVLIHLGSTLLTDQVNNRVWLLPSTSAAGVAALYLCLPDTEATLALAGGVGVAAIVAVLSGRPWWRASWVVTFGLIAATALDGTTRDSAVVAGSAIVVLHASVALLRPGPGGVAIAAAGMMLIARTAGLRPDTSGALLIAFVWTAVVICGVVTSGARASRSGTKSSTQRRTRLLTWRNAPERELGQMCLRASIGAGRRRSRDQRSPQPVHVTGFCHDPCLAVDDDLRDGTDVRRDDRPILDQGGLDQNSGLGAPPRLGSTRTSAAA